MATLLPILFGLLSKRVTNAHHGLLKGSPKALAPHNTLGHFLYISLGALYSCLLSLKIEDAAKELKTVRSSSLNYVFSVQPYHL
jgi:hypothetical protein